MPEIFGIGVDLTEKSRICHLFQTYGARFVNRILTPEENQCFRQFTTLAKQVEFLGGRFSAKESYSKAYGTGLGPIGFQDMAILNLKNGKPYFLYQPFSGRGLVTISHSSELVITEVILEKKQ